MAPLTSASSLNYTWAVLRGRFFVVALSFSHILGELRSCDCWQ